jgi:hypothetical protein
VRHLLVLLVVAAASAAVAAAGTAALQDGPAVPAATPATTTTLLLPPTTATTAAATAPDPAAPAPAPEGGVLLAWSQAGIGETAAAAAAAVPGVRTAAVVRDGLVELVASTDAAGTTVDRLDDGWRIPLDAIAVDPATYAEVVGAADTAAVAALGPGEALLSATSAELRRLGAGGVLELADGTRLQVAGVVPDAAVGAAEVVVDAATGAAIGVDAPRAVLVAHGSDRAAVEAAIVAASPGVPIRFRAPGETPYLRAGDGVLPQAIVKAAFGEFAYRPAGGGSDDVVVDPAWTAANIVDAEVPVFGTVRCHRAVVDALAGALAAVEEAGLGEALAEAGFDGCYVPRFTRSGGSLSRHTWGIAFDAGFGSNPTGAAPGQDDRVVAALAEAGFTWGGTWLVPDPAHFEVVTRPARQRPPR